MFFDLFTLRIGKLMQKVEAEMKKLRESVDYEALSAVTKD